MGRGLAVWRGTSKWAVACRTVGERRRCATQNQLLGLGVANNDGIVMAAGEEDISILHDRIRMSGNAASKVQ
jgi:hypothetical protein